MEISDRNISWVKCYYCRPTNSVKALTETECSEERENCPSVSCTELCMLYAGVSLAGVSCRRRPLHTAVALTTLLFQCELSGCVNWRQLWAEIFTQTWQPCHGDTAGYRLRWPEPTPVSLISIVSCFLILDAICPVPVFTRL